MPKQPVISRKREHGYSARTSSSALFTSSDVSGEAVRAAIDGDEPHILDQSGSRSAVAEGKDPVFYAVHD